MIHPQTLQLCCSDCDNKIRRELVVAIATNEIVLPHGIQVYIVPWY